MLKLLINILKTVLIGMPAIVQPYSLAVEAELDAKLLALGIEMRKAASGVFDPDCPHRYLQTMKAVGAVNGLKKKVKLLDHINFIRKGIYFPRTKWRLAPIKPGTLTDFQEWDLLSTMLYQVVHIYNDMDKSHTIPLHWLICRDKTDFIAGSWNMFSKHWLPLIQYMPDHQKRQTYDSVWHGVDVTQETRHYTAARPTFYRSRRKPMMSIPVFDSKYHYHYDQTHTDYEPKLIETHKNGKITTKAAVAPEWALKPFGFRPMLMKQQRKEPNKKMLGPGVFPTGDKHLECQVTIGDQIGKWLNTGAMVLVGTVDQWRNSRELSCDRCHTILPFSVERGKPRVCTDGGCLKAVSPDKIDCKLDAIQSVLKAAKPGAFFIKTDDSNGFQNTLLNDWSSAFCGVQLGNLIFAATALPFGLTQDCISKSLT